MNIVVNSLRRLVELETLYGTPSQHIPIINQLVYYYKQVLLCSLYKLCSYIYVVQLHVLLKF